MKELIGKLSRGIIEYDLPEAEVSVMSIEKKIEAGTCIRDSFEVFNKGDSKLKGIIYSTNEYVKLVNHQFIGKSTKIEYDVDTSVLEAGDVIEGRFNIVSNGGEFFVPYRVEIKEEGLPSSVGTVSGLLQFLNLVKTEYDEALKMFVSPDFERIVLGNDIAGQCMHSGLLGSNSRKRALEEFMIAVNKKQKVEFDISDKEREYDSLTDSYGDILMITRSTWGILEIEVTVEGDFISDCRSVITEEDFAGNNYEFNYTIDVEKLHAGMNYGRITFSSVYNTCECCISVDNIKEHDVSALEIKKCVAKINRLYLDFRMRRCQMDKWADESLSFIERARGFNDDNPFLKLLQAQICISKRCEREAKWLLDSVAEDVLESKEKNVSLYCYYLYVRTLEKRELEQTLMAADIIRKYYENGYDKWELLWILLYIDPVYENNKSLKLARIKEQYKLGCHSTLMYYEALYVFNKQPALLRVLNSFELQVLNFGSKYDSIELRLAVQISELAMLEKNFRPLLFRILVKLYEKFENKVILEALLSILIRGNRTETKYFPWFELGVKADIQVTRLYEYYIFSMPEDYLGAIPNTVLMYYVYNSNLLREREAFFYTLIIRNRDKQPNVYKNYVANIERFALENLRLGKMNDCLAVIYADVLKPAMFTEENERMLPKILNTWEIHINNDRIKEVIVRHKEIKKEEVYPITNGKAYIHIYTEDVIVMFRDMKNDIYISSIDYRLNKLYDNREFNEEALVRNPDNIYMMARECEQLLKYHKHLRSDVTLFKKIMEHKEFGEEYKNYIFSDIIEYYTDNYDGEELEEYLESIDVDRLPEKLRNEVVELMLSRAMYEQAGRYLRDYGITNIDARKILKYCTYILRNTPHDKIDEQEMTRYCNTAFRKGKYNETTLDYLCEHYNGTTKEMMEMWRVSKEFEFESRELEERIIAQMLFSRTNVSSICTIYDSYYKKGAIKIIKYAYFFFEAFGYFVKESPVDDMFFRHLETELMSENTLPDVCKCAYILYQSGKENISDNAKMICGEAIDYLEKKGIIFDFYKNFDRWIDISGNIMDKITILYRTEPKDKVIINYYIETGNLKPKDYISEEMKEVFEGVYTKSFTLFYGETINYYIVEKQGEDTMLTESREHYLADDSVHVNDSRYGKLNDILICRELKEENTVSEMAKEYFISNELVKKLF